MNKMQNMIFSFSHRNTRRRRLRRVLSFFMAITVFCTTYALILYGARGAWGRMLYRDAHAALRTQ